MTGPDLYNFKDEQMKRMILLGLFLFTNIVFADLTPLQRGIAGKNPGDVISLQRDEEIAAWFPRGCSQGTVAIRRHHMSERGW